MNFDRSIDPHRPLYHFSPPLGWWGGGPDGTIHHDGQYHVFYQFDPYMGSTSGNASWGHAVSRDLVHWEHRPVAIGPTPFGAGYYAAFARSDLVRSLDRSGIPPILYDREVCFSGSAVIDRGVPTLVYTGILHGLQDAPVMLGRSQCIATSDDGMLTWRKHPANPVIPHPPPGLADPSQRPEAPVWTEGVLPSTAAVAGTGGAGPRHRRAPARRRRGGRNPRPAHRLARPPRMAGGRDLVHGARCGFLGVGGAVLLYRSPDLISWEYMHPLCVGSRPGGTTAGWCRTSSRSGTGTCFSPRRLRAAAPARRFTWWGSTAITASSRYPRGSSTPTRWHASTAPAPCSIRRAGAFCSGCWPRGAWSPTTRTAGPGSSPCPGFWNSARGTACSWTRLPRSARAASRTGNSRVKSFGRTARLSWTRSRGTASKWWR